MALPGGISGGAGPQNLDLGAGPATGSSDGQVGAHGGNTVHYNTPDSLKQKNDRNMLLIGGVALAVALYLWKK